MAQFNEDGIEMYKNFYEVSICIHPKGSPAEDDYESVEFVDADNYFDAIKIAKRISLQKEYRGIKLKETHVVCWFVDDICTYNIRYQRVYRNGKYLYTWAGLGHD